MVEISGAQIVARCDLLGAAPYSDMENGLYRAFFTPAHAASINKIAEWMVDAGMSVRMDPAGTLIGRYEGREAGAPALLIGSHIDSVRNGGFYDGPLGVLLGVECVAALDAQGRRLSFAIEVVAFGDEEGSRFPVSMLCSRAMAGVLDEDAADIADGMGCSVAAARARFVEQIDLPIPLEAFTSAARTPGEIIAYFEPHIEQGPVLEAEGLAVGAVTGIAAQLRYDVEVGGKAGHAGTNAMGLRRDALAGAAEMICAVENIALEMGRDLVATVGKLRVQPGSVNVVPGFVQFSLDIRSSAAEWRDKAAAAMTEAFEAIAKRRGLELTATPLQDLPAAPCDQALIDLLQRAMDATGHPPRALVSGAGHDAMTMSNLCPTAMLFIRCTGGVSHTPEEHVSVADVDAAFATILNFIDLVEQSRR